MMVREWSDGRYRGDTGDADPNQLVSQHPPCSNGKSLAVLHGITPSLGWFQGKSAKKKKFVGGENQGFL